MVSEAKIAKRIARVKSAAPLASQPNRRSAKGPDSGLFRGGGLVMARPVSTEVRLKDISEAGSVDDIIKPSPTQAVVIDLII
jgi:hypothetical protein